MNSAKTSPSLAGGLAWLRKGSGRRRDAGPWREEIRRTISDPEKRVLWLVGSPSTLKQFLPVVEEYRASTTMLASSLAIADALRDQAKGNVSIAFAEFETAPVEGGYDLCIACPASSQIPDLYEEWLEGLIAPALKPGGVAILPWPMIDSTPAKTAETDDSPLRAFQDHHLRTERPSLLDVFAKSSNFELLEANKTSADRMAWLQLRKRESLLAKTTPTFSRSPRPDRFPMADFATFVRRLGRTNVKVLRTAEFAERFAKFAPGGDPAEGYGILKFDIHRGIRRAEEMARILSDASLPGLFLMMHRHDANRAFYDHRETWSTLLSIERMGHEVGLHIDPFDLVHRHGDLIAGITAATSEFREKGLSVATATLHGNTSAMIRTQKLHALDFFEGGKHVSTRDGSLPVGDDQWAEHLGRYSLSDLQSKSGIRYLAETTFGNAGTMIKPIVPLYVSDNTRFLRTSGRRGQRLRSDQPFRISYVLTQRIAVQMKQRPFLALFHPQWYW